MKSSIFFLFFLCFINNCLFEFRLTDYNQLQDKNAENYYENNFKQKEYINNDEFKNEESNSRTTEKPKCIYCKKLRDFEGWD
uniref:Uncharacterized protein n=1 Tax=Strongyloides papillosus TaxID=174720 RepID=A0A0N5C5D6_STREA